MSKSAHKPLTDAKPDTEFVVLLYPPHGVPRVCEVPHMPAAVAAVFPVQRYITRGEAETALEKFLTDNPAYRRWRDGRIQPENR